MKDNVFDCDIIAKIESGSTTSFKDIKTDSEESDNYIRERVIYIPNDVNFINLVASNKNYILYNKKIYSVKDPSYCYFASSYNYNRKLDNNVEIDFGDGYYPFKTTMYKNGCYDYGFIKNHPEFIGIAKYTTNQSYVYKNIGGEDRFVLQRADGKITGIESKDLQDILDNIDSDGLEFYPPVLIMDKGVTISSIGNNTKCYSVLFAEKIINLSTVTIMASSLPDTHLIINRLVLNTTDNKWYRYTYNGWEEDYGIVPIKSIGTTNERPQEHWRTTGTEYYDTDLKDYILWNGTSWVYKNSGYDAVIKIGTTTNRPSFTTDSNIGFEYYDTDLGKKILWNGTAWVNVDGTTLS